MGRKEAYSGEYQRISANIKKTIGRIPDDKFGWKPHEKSFTMGELASHLINIQSWIKVTLEMNSFDMQPNDDNNNQNHMASNSEELMNMYNKNLKEGTDCLNNTTEEELDKNWSLLSSGKELFTMPKIAVLRNFVFNHLIHHNAQLGVYLRLNDISLPAIYGPSADENIF